MARRFSSSRKVMPAGLVAGLALSMSAGFVAAGLW